MAAPRAVADPEGISDDHIARDRDAPAGLHADVAQRLDAAMAEAGRRVGQLVDPGGMQALLELSDRAEDLAGDEGDVIVQQQVDLRVLELELGLAVVLDCEFRLRLEQDEVVVLEVEHRVERAGAEGVVFRVGVGDREVSRGVARQMPLYQ